MKSIRYLIGMLVTAAITPTLVNATYIMDQNQCQFKQVKVKRAEGFVYEFIEVCTSTGSSFEQKKQDYLIC